MPIASKALLFANTDWYLFNFRLPLARRLVALGMEVVLVSPDGLYVERLRAAGFRVIVLDMQRLSVNPWSELRVLRALIGICRAERPDVVHSFTIKSVVYGSLAARAAGVSARISAVAGLGYVFASQTMYARMLRPLVKGLLRFALHGTRSRLVLQNHDDLTRFSRQRLIAPARVRLIRGSGVDTRRFVPRTERQYSGRTVVLMATRLLRDKGIEQFVAAARLCRANDPRIEFLLAGAPDRGNPASVQMAEVEQWHAEGVLVALGHVADMAALLATVDMVVLPTMYGEGVPRILLEGAAAGLPLIATETAGCTEIVQHNVTGLLVRPGDARDLAAAIMALHWHPEKAARMGAAARELAVEQFDEQIVLRKTTEIYAELGVLPARHHRPAFVPLAAVNDPVPSSADCFPVVRPAATRPD